MARSELPPPLPPETRTLGQLVAEALRLYGARFWPSLALGIGPAAIGVMLAELPRTLVWTLVPTVGTAAFSLAFVGACRLGLDGARTGSTRVALGVGLVAFLPPLVQRVAVLPGFDLVTLAYFALVGLSVPAVLVEGQGFVGGLRRGIELARADLVHALGSLATLVITIFLTGLVLFVVLHGVGDQAIRGAAFLALLVLAPLFLLGAALLYLDQAARIDTSRAGVTVGSRACRSTEVANRRRGRAMATNPERGRPAASIVEEPRHELTVHLGDWIARGAFAGLAAGLVFLLAQMAWATRSGKPAIAPLLDFSTVFHGSSKPVGTPPEALVGLVTHLNLSIAFGIGFAILAALGLPLMRSMAASAILLPVAGIAYGIALWVVNIQILGRTAFPWFTNPKGPPAVFEFFIHAAYGLILVPFFLGFARIAQRRRPAPLR